MSCAVALCRLSCGAQCLIRPFPRAFGHGHGPIPRPTRRRWRVQHLSEVLPAQRNVVHSHWLRCYHANTEHKREGRGAFRRPPPAPPPAQEHSYTHATGRRERIYNVYDNVISPSPARRTVVPGARRTTAPARVLGPSSPDQRQRSHRVSARVGPTASARPLASVGPKKSLRRGQSCQRDKRNLIVLMIVPRRLQLTFGHVRVRRGSSPVRPRWR